MKIKTSELSGPALDWAVAECTMAHDDFFWHSTHSYIRAWSEALSEYVDFSPSADWSQAGPIIEREWLHITPWPNEADEDFRWQCTQHDSIDTVAFGSTSLVAAMRCYVASKLGDTVEIPDELVTP